MRLIDADALIKVLVQKEPFSDCSRVVIAECMEEVRHAPTIEPEIIACDDCKYADDKPISDGRYWCSIHESFMYYCSDAERREEGDK